MNMETTIEGPTNPNTSQPVDKDIFYRELDKYYSDKKTKKPWSTKKIQDVINIIMEGRIATRKKTNEQYYYDNLYDIAEIGGIKKIIKKRKHESDPIIFVIPIEDFHGKLLECHISTGHGGRDKMTAYLKSKFYISRAAVDVFVKCCKRCAEKKSQIKKGIVVKPILSKGWNHRGQVDLIDFQSTPDGEYKWLLNYQDHLTKFVHLRPLKSKRAEEVAAELLKIFLEFGAPKILQSDNGREFVNVIIKEMSSNWSACKIVNGRPRHPQSQGSVERSNQDVENMLRSWLQDNDSQNWSLGCYYVQWHKNSSFHRTIGRSPYKALFGVDFQVGLNSTDLPSEILQNITTEEELEKITLLEANSNQTNENEIVNQYYDNETAENLMSATENINISEDYIHVEDIENIDIANIPVELVNCSECSINTKCILCSQEKIIHLERLNSCNGQKRAAEKMLQVTKKKLKDINIEDRISVNVPKVDRSPLDPKNILAIVIDIKNGVYQIGTENGILNRWFSRDEIIPNTEINSEDFNVPSDNIITLREAVSNLSKFGGQGFKKCACRPNKNQCNTKRCFCFKAFLKCNSRCHLSGPCCNK